MSYDLEHGLPEIVSALRDGHAIILPRKVLRQVPDTARGKTHELAEWLRQRGGLQQRPLAFECCQLDLVSVVSISEHMALGFRPTAIAERFLTVDVHGPASDAADDVRADIYPLPGTTLYVLAGTPDIARKAVTA